MAIGEQTPLLLRSRRAGRDHQDLSFGDNSNSPFHRSSSRTHLCTLGTDDDAGVWLSVADSSETVLVLLVWITMIGAVGYTLHHCSNRTLGMMLATTSTLSLACHAKTTLTDPGSVPPHAVGGRLRTTGSASFCVICQAHKPPLAHHCRICQRCVARMDHHCPFVQNCIGACNMKHFLLFLFYTLITCGLVLYESLSFPSTLVMALAWTVVIPSSSFVAYVLWNMLDNVKSGVGSIDRLQGKSNSSDTKRLHILHDVMGTNWWVILLPVDAMFRDPAHVLKYTTSGGENHAPGSVYSTHSSLHYPHHQEHLGNTMLDVLDV